MIQEIDQALIDWVAATLGTVHVSFEPPALLQQNAQAPNSDPSTETTRGIGLYLFDLVYQPAASSTPRLPLEISLSYLVTAWAPTIFEEHQQIGTLMFAALDNPKFKIQGSPLPLALWQALQAAPRPAFILAVPLKQERPPPLSPLVREVPILHTSPTTTLQGTVVGPENIPIAGAGVSLPTLNRSTRTSRSGLFSFDRVPTQPEVKQLQIQAKGRSYAISLEPVSEREVPLVIHLRDI